MAKPRIKWTGYDGISESIATMPDGRTVFLCAFAGYRRWEWAVYLRGGTVLARGGEDTKDAAKAAAENAARELEGTA